MFLIGGEYKAMVKKPLKTESINIKIALTIALEKNIAIGSIPYEEKNLDSLLF